MATRGQHCVLPQGVFKAEGLSLLVFVIIDVSDANLTLEIVDLIVGCVGFDLDVTSFDKILDRKERLSKCWSFS